MDEKSFGKLRSFLWPVFGHELKKFIPISILFFLISFNYHLLKILKDTLMITAPESGAEVIPYLKVWVILPSAIMLTLLFTKLSSKFNRENIFYVMTSIFLGFFALFIFFLYPKGETFQLHTFANFLTSKLPLGFKGFIAIIRYWPFAIFYIMAEAWSTIMLSLLLWMFVVDVLSIGEAKRFYAFFGISRNLAGVISGILGERLATQTILPSNAMNRIATFLGYNSSWDEKMFIFISLIILCGIVIIILYKYLHKFVFPNRYLMGSDIKNKGKQKISLKESILYIFKSKYVLCITIMVLSYNIFINSTEILWKSQIKELYPSSSAYTAYMSKITYLTGIIAAVSSYLISGNVVRRLGWKTAALITPIAMIITGLGFFYFLFLKKYAVSVNIGVAVIGISPLVLTVFFGSLQNIFSRAFKYTLFDDTKEMAFIPLSPSEKLQGKSAIDGIGSRLGKSGSSAMMQFLLMIFATPMGASIYIFAILILIMPFWLSAIKSLSKRFEELSATPKKSTKLEVQKN